MWHPPPPPDRSGSRGPGPGFGTRPSHRVTLSEHKLGEVPCNRTRALVLTQSLYII